MAIYVGEAGCEGPWTVLTGNHAASAQLQAMPAGPLKREAPIAASQVVSIQRMAMGGSYWQIVVWRRGFSEGSLAYAVAIYVLESAFLVANRLLQMRW